MIDVKDIEVKANGQWYSILAAIGVPESFLTGKHGACLFCGGDDRWRWDNKDNSGSYICNQCGSGTSFQLIMKHLGINFKEALERINEILGGGYTKTDTVKNKMSIDDVKKMLNRIWGSAVPLTGGDHVSKYLHSRGLVLTPDNIRFAHECYDSYTKKNYPAMIAKISNGQGVPIAIHRTFLNPDKPEKADIKPNRKMTAGTEGLVGGAIRLFPIKDNTLAIAEGVETSIACTQLFDIPTWAALSNTILEGFIPPKEVRKVIICADNDANYIGAKSAYVLANKLYNLDLIVEVRLVPEQGQDFCDVLNNMSI